MIILDLQITRSLMIYLSRALLESLLKRKQAAKLSEMF